MGRTLQQLVESMNYTTKERHPIEHKAKYLAIFVVDLVDGAYILSCPA